MKLEFKKLDTLLVAEGCNASIFTISKYQNRYLLKCLSYTGYTSYTDLYLAIEDANKINKYILNNLGEI